MELQSQKDSGTLSGLVHCVSEMEKCKARLRSVLPSDQTELVCTGSCTEMVLDSPCVLLTVPALSDNCKKRTLLAYFFGLLEE